MTCPNCGETERTWTNSDARREKVQWLCGNCGFQYELAWPIAAMATWPTDPDYRKHWVGRS